MRNSDRIDQTCPQRPAPPIRATRERLALALILLFVIVLLTAVFFPQSIASDVLLFVAGLLTLVIHTYFKQKKQ